MQYYGLDTTEVPEDAYGAPPPPPPPPVVVPGHLPGRRASDGIMIGPYQQSSPVQPTRPRHSMPAGVGTAMIGTATRQTGFAPAFDVVQVSALSYYFVDDMFYTSGGQEGVQAVVSWSTHCPGFMYMYVYSVYTCTYIVLSAGP